MDKRCGNCSHWDESVFFAHADGFCSRFKLTIGTSQKICALSPIEQDGDFVGVPSDFLCKLWEEKHQGPFQVKKCSDTWFEFSFNGETGPHVLSEENAYALLDWLNELWPLKEEKQQQCKNCAFWDILTGCSNHSSGRMFTAAWASCNWWESKDDGCTKCAFYDPKKSCKHQYYNPDTWLLDGKNCYYYEPRTCGNCAKGCCIAIDETPACVDWIEEE